jgi:hypothetical protein
VRVAFGIDIPHIGECQRYAGVKESEVAQAVGQGLVVVDGDCEYAGIGFECDSCPGMGAFAYYVQSSGGLSA